MGGDSGGGPSVGIVVVVVDNQWWFGEPLVTMVVVLGYGLCHLNSPTFIFHFLLSSVC